MHDQLGKLLGSPARVKLLRLFLFNPGIVLTTKEIATRARVDISVARRELSIYKGIALIRERKRTKEKSYVLNTSFTYLEALQHLLLNLPTRGVDISKRLRGVGVIRLIVLCGIFIDDYQGRIDLFVVGDRINEVKLKTAIRTVESEIGKELRYVFLKTDEFLYRLDIYDKLVRDVFDYPHTIPLDKLNIGLK